MHREFGQCCLILIIYVFLYGRYHGSSIPESRLQMIACLLASDDCWHGTIIQQNSFTLPILVEVDPIARQEGERNNEKLP